MNPRRAGRGHVAGWLLLAALVASPAPAAPARPAPAANASAVAVAVAEPQAEPFDPAASLARFTVALRMTGPVQGEFAAVDGQLQPVAGGLWRVFVQVQTTDLSLDGPDWMLRQTRSSRFLDVDRHPQIEFTSRGFRRELLASGGALAGELTLRGRKRTVVFRLEPAGCATPGHGCPIRVSGSVDRRDFGMTSQRLWLRDSVGFEFRVRLKPAGPP